jgi:excisionase family DNA binding protein
VNEEFLTVSEIAETLKLNPQTVRNWIDRDELPALRVGSRRVRVRKSDFEAFLAREPEPRPPHQPRDTRAQPTSIVVYRGVAAPELQRRVGPLKSRRAAEEWLEQEGVGVVPSEDDAWAVVFPVGNRE